MKRFTFLLAFLLCAVLGIQSQNLTLPYNQDFSSLSSGDMLSATGSANQVTAPPSGIISVSSAYEAGGVLRLGDATSTGGFTTAPLLLGSSSTIRVSFRAVPWTSATPLPAKVTITYGTQTKSVNIIAASHSWPLAAADMEDFYSVDFDADVNPASIAFSTTMESGFDQRLFVDDLTIKTLVMGDALTEGFDQASFPPLNWQAINEAGSQRWSRTINNNPLGAASAFVSNGSSNPSNWLITPRLKPVSGQNLSFKIKKPYFVDGTTTMSVKISTGGSAISEFTNTVLVVGSSVITTGWFEHTADLSAYVGQDIFVAFHVQDANGFSVMLDDIRGPNVSDLWCPAVKNLSLLNVSDNNAVLSWSAAPNSASYIVQYSTSADFSAGTSTMTVSGNTVTINGLTDNTAYYVRVQSLCGGNEESTWSNMLSFRTSCSPVSTISENFNQVTNHTLPSCWTKLSDFNGGNKPGVVDVNTTNGITSKALSFFGSLINYAITPKLDAPLNTKQLSFKLNKESSTCGAFQVGYMSNPVDESTFVPVATFNDNIYKTFVTKVVSFHNVPDNGGANRYIAFRYGNVGSVTQDLSASYYIDDVSLSEANPCPAISETSVQFFGLDSAVISFVPTGTASSWQYTSQDPVTTAPGSLVVTDISSNNIVIEELVEDSTYNVWIRNNCGSNSYGDWASTTFTAAYCKAHPSSVDRQGITNVSFGIGLGVSNSSTNETNNYGNYSHMVGLAERGSTVQVDITYGTGYTYHTKIYVDWNGDLDFFDAGELVYTGESLGANPTTLNASFVVPSTVSNGKYRMRIVGTDSNEPSPCYSETYGTVEDYSIRVIAPMACRLPSALQASNITDTSADIAWTAGGSESNWDLVISPVALDSAGLATATKIAVNSTPSYQATGLLPNTQHYMYVRANCGANDGVSLWSKGTLKTLVAGPVQTPYYQNFSGTFTEFSSFSNTSNTWSVGSAVGNSGESMYISSNNGDSANYTNFHTYAATSIELAFDNNPTFILSFDWQCAGEFDYSPRYNRISDGMRVYLVPATMELPTTWTDESLTGQWLSGTGVHRIGGNFIDQDTWTTFTDTLPPGIANTVQKLVFMWKNDNSTIRRPVASVDNISVSAVYCDAPVNIALDSVSNDHAVVVWNAGGAEASWQVEYRKNTETTWTLSNSATSVRTVALSGLEGNTQYTVRVRANCGTPGQYSVWKYFDFETLCDAYSIGNTRVIYSFDENINSIPECWMKPANYTHDGTEYPIVQNISTASTNGALMFIGRADQVAVTGKFVEQANTLEVELSIKRESALSSGTFEIGVMSDPFDPATFVVVDNLSNRLTVSDGNYQRFTVSLASAPAGNHYVAFRQIAVPTEVGYYEVDNVDIHKLPTCITPTNIGIAFNDPTYSSVEINWVSQGSEPSWAVKYKHADSIAWISTTTTTNSVILTGLAPNNDYEVKVAAVCIAGNDSSLWSAVVSFSTPCLAASMPFTEDFSTASPSVFPSTQCWDRYSNLAVNVFNGEELQRTTSGWRYSADTYGINSSKAKMIVWHQARGWLVTPPIALQPNSRLEFDLALTGQDDGSAVMTDGFDDQFMVIISTDGGITWSANNAVVWNNTGTGNYVFNDISSNAERVSIDLSQYSGTVRIAFYAESVTSNAYNSLHIDNISVSREVVVPPTVATLDATDITTNSATLNKQVTPGTNMIDLEGFYYRVQGVGPWRTSVDGNITGLNPNTTYEFYAYAMVNGVKYDGETKTFTTLLIVDVPLTQYGVAIYPNPAESFVTVTVEGLTNRAEVTVIDVQGKTVGQYAIKNGSSSIDIDVTPFAEGSYIVRIVSEGRVQTERLIVKK